LLSNVILSLLMVVFIMNPPHFYCFRIFIVAH